MARESKDVVLQFATRAYPEAIGEPPTFWADIEVHHDKRDKWTHLEPIPTPWHCTLYRMFNAEQEPLYIGTTVHPNRRFTYHRRKKDWWPEVSRIELWLTQDTIAHQTGDWIDHQLREHTARAWESLCVMTQKPKYNMTARG